MTSSTTAEAQPERSLVVGVLGTGLIAISFGAILVRLAAAPSLAIAFWRVGLALVVLAPWVLLAPTRRLALASLGGRDWLRLVGSGLCLGIHFWSWISSLAYTSVAASVLLVTTNPIWVGLLSPWLLGERLGARKWLGIVVATAGASLVALGAEAGGSAPAPMLGNALALLGAVAASGYLMLGRLVRQRLDLPSYAALTLLVAWTVLGIGLLANDLPLRGFDTTTWLAFAGMALGPQLIGHNAISWSLRWLRADRVAVSILFEPIGAAALAWLILGERPTLLVGLGGAVLIAGVAAVILEPDREAEAL